MVKKILILLVVFLVVGVSYIFFSTKKKLEQEKISNWHWKEYPVNFFKVDCNTVPITGDARPGSDILQTTRSICWEERAWYENNWEFCNNLDEFEADNCLTWMAIKLKNENICKSQKVKDVQNCIKLVKETSNEDTWHFKDNINKGINPL